MMVFRTQNASETWRLGRWIGERLPPGAVVGLDGDLGTGKTWMAKGIVKGAGECDDEIVKSPAFNLVHEYRLASEKGPVSVVHVDFYRLDSLSDADFFLFSEYLERPGAICLVEWAEKFLPELAPAYLSIRLSLVDGEGPTVRDIRFSVTGESDAYDVLLEDLRESSPWGRAARAYADPCTH
jgi:tRNA threonylcarbamoyladenosine biosynthesis protein TsaE